MMTRGDILPHLSQIVNLLMVSMKMPFLGKFWDVRLVQKSLLL